MTTTTTTRIAANDIIAMDTKGFWALREDCVTRTELDEIAYTASEQWLAEASEAEREADPCGQMAYERAYESWAASAYDGYIAGAGDGALYTPIDGLLQEAVRDNRLEGGWGVSTGSGRAAMRPHYVVKLGGRDIHLAPAYPSEYKSRTPSTY